MFITFIPFLIGYLNEDRNKVAFNNSLFVLAITAGVSLLLSFLTTFVDLGSGKLLILPENDPKVQKLRENMSKKLRKLQKRRNTKKAEEEYQSLHNTDEYSANNKVIYDAQNTSTEF